MKVKNYYPEKQLIKKELFSQTCSGNVMFSGMNNIPIHSIGMLDGCLKKTVGFQEATGYGNGEGIKNITKLADGEVV